ncbi:hypothetical protein NFI96_021787 [Prochilodus magdalenae]|nr:hypothetical protein NFI96_021787 [Prochilodus magdalenae]
MTGSPGGSDRPLSSWVGGDLIRSFPVEPGLRSNQLRTERYVSALQKLANQYLKRDWPGIKPDDQRTDYRNVYGVWRAYLEGTVQVTQSRLFVCENYKNEISDPAKTVRLYKEQQLKKCIEQLGRIQAELQDSVKDLAKSKKKYFELEQMAQAVREKADIEAKYVVYLLRALSSKALKLTVAELPLMLPALVESSLCSKQIIGGKSGSLEAHLSKLGLFQSRISLQKASVKLKAKRSDCNSKATHARNEYLLTLAAANAHQDRYYQTDLASCIKYI